MIPRKLKPCIGCGDPCFIWARRMCHNCDALTQLKDKPKAHVTLKQTTNGKVAKPFKAISKVSSKQQKLNVAYLAQRKVYLKNNPHCLAVTNDCSFAATDIHHKRGRVKYLLDETTWLPVCRECHIWIETHPEKAKELGLSLNRLDK